MSRPGPRGYEAGPVTRPRAPFVRRYESDGSLSADLYHGLLHSSWSRLLLYFLTAFVGVNALFALGYLAQPDALENARPGSFPDAFFFSVQTIATIGYGKMVPRTTYANVMVTLEVMVGVLGLALMTGLVFAKFARPTARVLFSRVAVVGPRDGVRSLMFRMGNERGTSIAEAQAHVVLVRDEITAEGERIRRFYDLELVRRQSVIFPMSWTVIHRLVAPSPLHDATPASLAASQAEIYVSVSGFDEIFAQTVHARHVYRAPDVVWEARFVDILSFGPDGARDVDRTRFHDVVRTTVPT